VFILKKTQPYGEEASEFAKNVFQEGKEVELEKEIPNVIIMTVY
jgi:endonuclease YncB( thermonuclease family)